MKNIEWEFRQDFLELNNQKCMRGRCYDIVFMNVDVDHHQKYFDGLTLPIPSRLNYEEGLNDKSQ